MDNIQNRELQLFGHIVVS